MEANQENHINEQQITERDKVKNIYMKEKASLPEIKLDTFGGETKKNTKFNTPNNNKISISFRSSLAISKSEIDLLTGKKTLQTKSTSGMDLG